MPVARALHHSKVIGDLPKIAEQSLVPQFHSSSMAIQVIQSSFAICSHARPLGIHSADDAQKSLDSLEKSIAIIKDLKKLNVNGK